MKWSGTAWAFFPQYILDGFVVSKWAPQYATEQFVVLFRYNRCCEAVPHSYWPKDFGVIIYFPFEKVYLHGNQIHDLLHWSFPLYALSHCYILKAGSPPHNSSYRRRLPATWHQLQTFSALYCRSIRAARMWNQHSLWYDTEKWYLCNNTNEFVSHCFSQIFVQQVRNL